MVILALETPEVTGSQIWAVEGLTDLDDVMLCQNNACTTGVDWAGALS